MLEGLRVLAGARGFVGGELREAGNAFGLLVVRFLQRADLGLELAEQLEQFALALLAYGARVADLRLNFAYGFFNHRLNFIRCRKFGKQVYHRPTFGKTGRTRSQMFSQTTSTGAAPLTTRTRSGSAAAMAS